MHKWEKEKKPITDSIVYHLHFDQEQTLASLHSLAEHVCVCVCGGIKHTHKHIDHPLNTSQTATYDTSLSSIRYY